MLKSLDILIGFSVIMLAVSMAVTLIIQAILNLLGMRGKKLLEGVVALIRQIDPQLLTEQHATELANQILRHPMLSSAPGKLADVVQREDLIKVILTVAAGAVVVKEAAAGAETTVTTTTAAAERRPSEAEQALVQALSRTGISNPRATLDAIRMVSMRMEAARPELASHVREAIAVIHQAESQFVARVNGAFDQTMERVSHSFTGHSRIWGVAISLLLAFVLQLDSFRLVNRLAMDDALRNTLVQQSAQAAAMSGTEQLHQLATDSLITWPDGWDNWKKQMGESSVFGLLLTAALLSLGAPFWFNVLGDLLKLRPMLASREDAQRQDRETSQVTAGAG